MLKLIYKKRYLINLDEFFNNSKKLNKISTVSTTAVCTSILVLNVILWLMLHRQATDATTVYIGKYISKRKSYLIFVHTYINTFFIKNNWIFSGSSVFFIYAYNVVIKISKIKFLSYSDNAFCS